jgi:hypothetical protein
VAALSSPPAEDVDRAVDAAQQNYPPQWYHYFGGLADKIEGAVIPIDKPDTFNFTRHEPLARSPRSRRGIHRRCWLRGNW